jgi:DNA-binding NarL/FixJ family response regulator
LPDLFTDEQWAALAKRFRLSRRQRQAARLICLGYSNTAIGRELGLRPDTVRMHNRELFKKLDIRHRMGVPLQLVLAEREFERRRES